MANNEYTPLNTSNRVVMVDPNLEDMGSVPLEDLCIIVDLQATQKQRINITTRDSGVVIEQTNGGNFTVNFISGTKQGDTRSLTTNYTNIGYKEPTTIFNNDSDLEGLGITNIDINFTSSYAPQIVIDMIDIRGSSVLEQGNESKYNIFFNMPYPIFKLTIKGYYGQAVTYCLHLTKWNAKFNSQTGNFEIRCEFIGHTYAFLTDMLIGYLRAAAETSKGKELLKQKKLDNPGVDIMTISELIGKIDLMGKELEKIKNNNNSIKDLEIIKVKLSNFDTILQEFINFRVNHSTSNNNNNSSIIGQTSDGITIFDNTRVSNLIEDINTLEKNLLSTVTEINKNTDISEYKLYLDNYKSNTYLTYNGTIGNFKSKTSIANAYISKITKEQYDSIVKLFGIKSEDTRIIITDWTKAYKEIETKKVILKNLEKSTTTDVSNEISNIIDSDIGLNPSIRNIISILAVHVDIFMELIRGVAIKCGEDKTKRSKDFEKALDNIDINKNTSGNGDGMLGLIYPFPGYDDNGKEAWIGNKITNIPETDFIEELLIGFLTVAKSDEVLESKLENGGSAWYPSCLLDTSLFGGENIYNINKDIADYRLLLDIIYKRLFLFFGFTNTSLSDNEINNMALIEANNVYKYINGKSFSGPISAISNKTVPELITEMLKISKYKNIGDSYQYIDNIPVTTNIAGRFIYNNKIEDNTTYIKLYDYDTEYIKSTGTYPSYEITNYKGSNNIINLTEIRKKKYTSYDSLSGQYKCQEFFNFTYDGATESSYDVDLLFWCQLYRSNISAASIINNSFNLYYKSNWESISYLRSGKIPFLNKKYIGFQSEDTSYNYNYSLFGSELYFRQLDNIIINGVTEGKKIANRARALLFLHTLPFDGLAGPKNYGLFNPINDGNDIGVTIIGNTFNAGEFGGDYNLGEDRLNLFNKRGGFIKIPRAWLLLVGGLLWRKQQSADPIIFMKDSHGFFIRDDTKVPSKDEYLKYKLIIDEISDFVEPERFGTGMGGYVKIEEIFNNLPKQVTDTLINYFLVWTDGVGQGKDNTYILPESYNWNSIRQRYELEIIDNITTIADYNNLISNRNTTWVQASKLYESDGQTSNSQKIKSLLLNNPNYNKNNINICNKVTCNDKIVNYNQDKIGNDIKANYDIEYVDTNIDTSSNSIDNMIRHIIEPIIVANATWRIWVDPANTVPDNYTNDFSVSNNGLTKYLTEFQKNLKTLTGVNSTSDDALKARTFGIIDNDIIKLNLYRTIKAIYDKWIAGTNLNIKGICDCSNNKEQSLISSFRFLDKAFRDIGDEFLVNPLTIRNMIKFNTNQSFYELTSQILVGNNMDFIPLPNYINYRDPKQIEKMFNTYSYADAIEENTIGPTFICMYVGQTSKHVDTNDNLYKTDSIKFIKDDGSELPDAFNDPDGDAIPVFAVNYAQGNQSIFKDIRLDQSEFSETDESLRVIDEISLQGDKITRTPIGQNLFNVYSTRSYQTEIEMLGNAMIQPMMYFQLNNIPMFRGGYLINRTSHNIKPNHMTTTFKGVRVNKIMTPLLNRSTLFMNLLGSLSEVDISKSKLTALSPTEITYTTNTCTTIVESSKIAFYDLIIPKNINPKGMDPNSAGYITREDFISKLVEVSNNLNINPNWLITTIVLESGINVDNRNKNGDGANGLIQWIPNTINEIRNKKEIPDKDKVYKNAIDRISIGKNWGSIKPYNKLPKMNGVEQLELVEIFYKNVNKNNLVKSFYEIAVYAFAPRYLLTNTSINDTDTIYDSSNDPAAIKNNSTFDLNNDGIITYSEFKEKKYRDLSRYYPKYLNEALCTKYVGSVT